MCSDTVMVIEDEKPSRTYTARLLQAEGYSVVEATHGSEGLALANQVHPRVILCDVNLGDMSGFAVLESLRTHPSTRRIPFIFLSGKAWALDMQVGLQLWADQFLMKPVIHKELLAAVASQLCSLEAQQLIEEQTPPSAGMARALWIYDRVLKGRLESQFMGWWVAIEQESGRCFLGQSECDALQIARQSMPRGVLVSLDIETTSLLEPGAFLQALGVAA